jgi:hypothetical protein
MLVQQVRAERAKLPCAVHLLGESDGGRQSAVSWRMLLASSQARVGTFVGTLRAVGRVPERSQIPRKTCDHLPTNHPVFYPKVEGRYSARLSFFLMMWLLR